MLSIVQRDSLWVCKDRGGLLKADTMFLLVSPGFVCVPLKDIVHRNALSTYSFSIYVMANILTDYEVVCSAKSYFCAPYVSSLSRR
jgi:hypothetical protein